MHQIDACKKGTEMPSENETRDDVETPVEKTDSETSFDRIMNLPFMQGSCGMKQNSLPYSKLGNRFFDKMEDKLAEILPVLALGYNDPEVRRLANELFASLCLHRNGSDT